MKYLNLITLIMLSACGSTPKPSDQPKAIPANVISPVVTPTPSPSSTPITTSSTPVCSAFNNTVWISNTNSSMVSTFNNVTGTFLEQFQGLNCNRQMSQGAAFGSSMSLVWPNTGILNDVCNSVPAWMQFSVSSCNVLTVIFRDGNGNILETNTYHPQ